MRRDAIRETLAQRCGDAADARAVAEATVGTWLQMAARLAPVIGVRGVDVLFGRALYLTSAKFPWLAISEHGDAAAQLASIRARLEAHEAAVAAEAGYVLLATFTELLATLIGEALTERLLLAVWAPSPPASELAKAS
ncbi:MAG: hypothetical protein PHY45_09995 [Rhodocyclaceae bacterium]|nr:hypothetical protein [Rhodocyclaceae bacterium]